MSKENYQVLLHYVSDAEDGRPELKPRPSNKRRNILLLLGTLLGVCAVYAVLSPTKND